MASPESQAFVAKPDFLDLIVWSTSASMHGKSQWPGHSLVRVNLETENWSTVCRN